MKVVEVVAGAALVAFSIFAPALFPFATHAAISLIAGASLSLGTSLVLGGVSGLISKGVMQSAQGRTITARQAAAPWRIVYGVANIGGILTFMNVSGSQNEYLDMVITLAGHQLNAIGQMYLSGVPVPIDGNGNAGQVPSGVQGGGQDYTGKVHVEKNYGTPNQAAFPGLIENSNGLWTAAHTQSGRAGVYVRLKWDPKLFANGMPNITFDVQGRPVYEPRSPSFVWAGSPWNPGQNSTLTLSDYLLSCDFGLGRLNATLTNGGSGYTRGDVLTLQNGDSNAQVVVNAVTAGVITSVFAFRAGTNLTSATGVTVTGGTGSGALFTVVALPNEVDMTQDISAANSCDEVITLDNATFEGQGTNDLTVTGTYSGTQNPQRFTVKITNQGVGGQPDQFQWNEGTGQYQGQGEQIGEGSAYWNQGIPIQPGVPYFLGDGIYITFAAGQGHTIGDTWVVMRGTEPRYATNGVFDLSEEPGTIITQLATAMAGYCVWSGGMWELYPGIYRGPTVTLDSSVIVSPITLTALRSRRDLFNGVKGTFMNYGNQSALDNFPAVLGANYLTEDGVRIWKDIVLPFTTTPTACQRISKILLERNRRQKICEFTTNLAGYQVQPGDVLRINFPTFSWSNKTFDVTATQFSPQQDKEGNPILVVSLTLTETDATVYAFNSTDQGAIMADLPVRLPGVGITGTGGPPAPDASSVSFVPETGQKLKTTFTIPPNADYAKGSISLYVDTDDPTKHVETTASGTVSSISATLTVADSTGFFVGDLVRDPSTGEIFQIEGPGPLPGLGTAPTQPTSNTWQITRNEMLTPAAQITSGNRLVRLGLVNHTFPFLEGFSLTHAGLEETEEFSPGKVRIYYASLQFEDPSGGQSAIVEQPLNFDAPNVTSPSISEDGDTTDGTIKSHVTVSWTNPVNNDNFGGVDVYRKASSGMAASSDWELWQQIRVPQDDEGFADLLQRTGETLYVAFVSVNAFGAENFFNDAPGADGSIFAVLDGNDSAPTVPQSFSAQFDNTLAQNIILSWRPNTEADLDHYDVARRQDGLVPGEGDVKFVVQKGGGNSSSKIQQMDSPGVSTLSYRYWVRAVDAAGNKSSFTGPVTATALAPDGTTDITVPDQPPVTVFFNPIPGFQIWAFPTINPGSLQVLYSLTTGSNWAGVKWATFSVSSYSNVGLSLDHRTDVFRLPANMTASSGWAFIPLENRYVDQVTVTLTNYFGDSTPKASNVTDLWTGSQAQGAKPITADFDPAVQDMGASRITGRKAGTNDFELAANGGKVRSVSRHSFDSGLQISSGATSGRYLRGNGTDFVENTIQSGDLPSTVSSFVNFTGGAGLRNFNQSSRPTLNTDECAFWYDNGGATHSGEGGLLYFDGTNYWWWAAVANGAVTAYVNPVA